MDVFGVTVADGISLVAVADVECAFGVVADEGVSWAAVERAFGVVTDEGVSWAAVDDVEHAFGVVLDGTFRVVVHVHVADVEG